MATVHRFVPTPMMRPTLPLPSSSHHQFMAPNISTLSHPISTSHNCLNPRKIQPFHPVELDRIPSIPADVGNEMVGQGFFEAIEELERMAREPADILEAMHGRLSDRELHLVLVYFSQEGRDSWCALEVFDWLRKENRADGETVELMVTIMCGWVEKMVRGDHAIGDVVALLKDMECVGLTPRFSMIEKVISLYWEVGKKAEAVIFVRDVLEQGIDYTVDGGESNKGGPTGYLAWKMIVDGDYLGAVKLVIEFKESGLKPEVYSYLITMTALVKELNEFSKALRKLKGLTKAGLIPELDSEDMGLVEKYQSDLISAGVRLSDWAIEEASSELLGVVHERLLAMFTCAGRGLEAERQLWHMKLAGKEPDRELYDMVLAICASQKEDGSIRRLLARMEAMNLVPGKKTLSWLLRGYIKGGYFEDASRTLMKMLDMGLKPEYLDRAAVLQGLRKAIQQSGDIEPYLNLCKRLADVDLVGPCLVYLYISGYRLWVIKML